MILMDLFVDTIKTLRFILKILLGKCIMMVKLLPVHFGIYILI